MVYIPEKDETEPARILTTIFKDDGEKFFELTVATPSIEKEDLKDAMAGWIIFLYIALLLTIIVINVWVFYRNMRPLYVLLHWLDKYRIGKVNEPLQNNTRVSEFRKLNEAAVRYAERSEQMFEQQKQFIGNASHEMQTPLAICRNRLEMLMEDENLSESQLEELLSMLAIATVCDVVDLTGENRIFVKEGLRRIKDTQNIGLKALLNVHDLMDKQIQSYALGFIVGPCINASGRLESAEKALNLFLEEDEEKAKQTAEELKELNDLRKTMTENGVKEALGQAFEYEAKGDKVLVLYLPECHESIAGIIAGRIKDRLNHPAFVLTDAKEGIKGSGRSIEGYSMFEEMMKVKEVFTKFGGHPMAAGCSLEKEKLQEFRKKINENCTLEKKDFCKESTD